jgi:hypothetical protein
VNVFGSMVRFGQKLVSLNEATAPASEPPSVVCSSPRQGNGRKRGPFTAGISSIASGSHSDRPS